MSFPPMPLALAEQGEHAPCVGPKIKKPPQLTEAFDLNRATSYSPTHLRVQYHRG